MKVLHIIKKMDKETNRPLGLTQIQPKVNRYMSCCWDFDIEEMKQLIEIADQEMYATKQRGGNGITIHKNKIKNDD